MKYTYTATFVPFEDLTGFYARIPDLPGCVTTGKSLEDAIDQIKDAASLWLVSAEDHNDPIPAPTPQNEIHPEEPSIFSLIQVDTIAYRAATDTRAVRKNVSLPAWMVQLAEKRNINCSQLLQDSLLAKFSQ